MSKIKIAGHQWGQNGGITNFLEFDISNLEEMFTALYTEDYGNSYKLEYYIGTEASPSKYVYWKSYDEYAIYFGERKIPRVFVKADNLEDFKKVYSYLEKRENDHE